MEITFWPIDRLLNNPVNIAIYGDTPDQEFLASVRKFGVTTPLKVLPDGTLIGGHRRRQALKILGYTGDVPVIILDGLSDDEQLLALCLDNEGRQETVEQRVKRAKIIEQVEARMAAERLAETQAKPGEKVGPRKAGSNLTQPTEPEKNAKSQNGQGRNPRAADTAAKAAKMSRSTYEKAKEVEAEIERAKANGQADRAEHLSRVMNDQSVTAAHRIVTAAPAVEPKAPSSILKDKFDREIPDKFREIHAMAVTLANWHAKLVKVANEIKNLSGMPGTHRAEIQDNLRELRKAAGAILMGAYLTTCPACDAKGCVQCLKLGWLSRADETTYKKTIEGIE